MTGYLKYSESSGWIIDNPEMYNDENAGNYSINNNYAEKSDIPTEFDLSTKTTDDLSQGITDKYYNDTIVGNYLTTNNYAKISDIQNGINETRCKKYIKNGNYYENIKINRALEIQPATTGNAGFISIME